MLAEWLLLDLGLRFLPLRWFRVPPLMGAMRWIYGARNSPFLYCRF